MKKKLLVILIIFSNLNLFSQAEKSNFLTDSVSKEAIQFFKGEDVVVVTENKRIKDKFDYVRKDTIYLYKNKIAVKDTKRVRHLNTDEVNTLGSLSFMSFLIGLGLIFIFIVLWNIFGEGTSLFEDDFLSTIAEVLFFTLLLVCIVFSLGLGILLSLPALIFSILGRRVRLRNKK